MISRTPIGILVRIASVAALTTSLVISAGSARAEESHAGHNQGTEAHGEEGHEEHSDEVTISPEAMTMFGITVESVSPRRLTEIAPVPARVAYNSEAIAHVGTPVSGRASEIKVKLGDHVAKGDLLVVVDSVELGGAESDLLEKESLLEASKSAVEVARIAFQRAEELRKTNSVGVTDFLARQGEMKKAEGELKVAEAVRMAAENRLHILGVSQGEVERLRSTGEVSSRYEIRAPIAGTIVEREVTPGEIVGPDREALLVLADMATLWVLADVPERLAHRVQVGSKGRILLGSLAHGSLEATVSYIAPELNPRTRTAQVRLVVDASSSTVPSADEAHEAEAAHDHDHGHDHAEAAPELTEARINPALAAPAEEAATANAIAGTLLRPGMFADVELDLTPLQDSTAEEVLAIPEEAIQTVEGKISVFVPSDEPNTYKPQPLVVGRRVGRFVQVISGLSDGDSYVASGSFILKAELGKAGAEHVH